MKAFLQSEVITCRVASTADSTSMSGTTPCRLRRRLSPCPHMRPAQRCTRWRASIVPLPKWPSTKPYTLSRTCWCAEASSERMTDRTASCRRRHRSPPMFAFANLTFYVRRADLYTVKHSTFYTHLLLGRAHEHDKNGHFNGNICL